MQAAVEPDLFERLQTIWARGGARGLAAGLIGKDAGFDGPWGRRRLLYADYVASGRALMQVEQAVMEHVLP